MKDTPRVLALGFFDGVHIGHATLLSETTRLAQKLGACPCALTFDRHPESLITGHFFPLINTLRDRVGLIRERFGVEEVIVARFDSLLMQMPWQNFINEMLIKRFSSAAVVAGHDFHFGHLGQGNAGLLASYGEQQGLVVSVMPRVDLDGITVSSTYIRKLIAQGDLRRAGRFLGHPHILTGVVARGRQLGSSLGAPTVNLPLPAEVQCPALGVYASLVEAEGRTYRAVTNVGVRPPVTEDGAVSLESFLLDFEGNLYNRVIRLSLLHFLRPEQKFLTLAELAEQIRRDADRARAFHAEEDAQA